MLNNHCVFQVENASQLIQKVLFKISHILYTFIAFRYLNLMIMLVMVSYVKNTIVAKLNMVFLLLCL